MYVKFVHDIKLHCSLLLPAASFDMKISVDGLFFIGSQLVTLSYNGKVAVGSQQLNTGR